MSEIVDRSIEVEWENEHPKLTKRFSVTSKRTYDLFGEIEGHCARQGHLVEGRLYDDEEGKLAEPSPWRWRMRRISRRSSRV